VTRFFRPIFQIIFHPDNKRRYISSAITPTLSPITLSMNDSRCDGFELRSILFYAHSILFRASTWSDTAMGNLPCFSWYGPCRSTQSFRVQSGPTTLMS
jgi:hypothetical protein